MIKVTVDLHSAIDGHQETLSTLHIWNDGSGSKTTGNYGYHLFGRRGHMIRSGIVLGYPRHLTVPNLLYRVLKDAVGDKND